METVRTLRAEELAVLLGNCHMVKVVRLCVLWSEEFELPWARSAREAAGPKLGTGRWVTRLKPSFSKNRPKSAIFEKTRRKSLKINARFSNSKRSA